MEATRAGKSSESEVDRENGFDSCAGRGGRSSGQPLRPQAFRMVFNSGASSFAHVRLRHPSDD